ncbi:MAG TPA: preprotein translocase subunit SecD, partial [Methanosarcina sp.]|nr:preprotein translocase subunit SecD [Methanosarcina sp.]
MSDKKSIFKNVRVIIFILALLASIVLIQPGYNSEEGATTNLNYGLDLEGGSWLQIKLQGALVQVDADPSMIVTQMVEPIIGAPIQITKNDLNTDGAGSSEKSITFTTSVPVSASQLELLELGSVSVDRLNQNMTQVTIATSKEALIKAYLSQAFDAEILPIGTEDGVIYEIRTEASEEDVEALMGKVGGTILRNEDGTSTYREGVSTETRDLTRDILNDKLNSLGLKDIPVRTVGEDYILIDFAGIDLATAKDIAEKPGKFEIRIQTTGNETRHVLYGDSVVSVGIPTFHDNQWHTPFTLNEEGARALQSIAIETGATDNPDAHYLNMYLDENKVYGAPLSYSAASRLKETPIYSWEASTGSDEVAKTEAEAL